MAGEGKRTVLGDGGVCAAQGFGAGAGKWPRLLFSGVQLGVGSDYLSDQMCKFKENVIRMLVLQWLTSGQPFTSDDLELLATSHHQATVQACND